MKLLGWSIVLLVLIACGVTIFVRESRKDSSPFSAAPTAPAPRAAPTSSAASTQVAGLSKDFATVVWRSADKLAARWHGLSREIADLASARPATALSAASAQRLALLKQGDRLLAGGHFPEAVGAFTKACDVYPDDADALEGLAVAMVAAEQFSDSLAVYQRLLKLDGNNATTLFNYAVALSRLHKLSEAQQVYRTLIAGHEDFLQARYNLASVYEADGKLTLAREQWKEVIALGPDMAYPHAKLGELLLDLGDATQAMQEFAQAAKLEPDNADGWKNYSAAAQVSGSFGIAIAAANKAARIAPASAAELARLGGLLIDLYERTGQDNLRTQALEAWRQCIKLDAEQHVAAKMITQYDSPATSRPTTAPG
jgi:tetratricopeptide (TPR) repeat protein